MHQAFEHWLRCALGQPFALLTARCCLPPSQSGSVELLYRFIKHGANLIRSTMEEGTAPIHVAAEAVEVECLELLLDFGSNADQQASRTLT